MRGGPRGPVVPREVASFLLLLEPGVPLICDASVLLLELLVVRQLQNNNLVPQLGILGLKAIQKSFRME